jgi:uncharacterized circularly permuted ATP-grasp superfamily protein/uncharacterized alpha-E superfamily protein
VNAHSGLIDPMTNRGEGQEPAARAASIAPWAAAGHFDELRGAIAGSADPHTLPCPAWRRFFDTLGREGFSELNRRTANLQRQVRDNGITYNVYADEHAAVRPWPLELFPLIVTRDSWQQIEAGVLQLVRLLDRIMEDVYGPQQLLAKNLLPPALVQGHPGFARAMQGVQPPACWLHIAAFDLARGPQGNWWVVSQRTQAPSGLGYLLENRLIISRLFPESFGELRVQRLAATYRAFVDGLRFMCRARGEPRIVLLTPGRFNETYFEHAFLARHLGLTLVEGSDLVVRGERLFLKTIEGLEPVHGVIKRVDDEFLDPLEMRSDSQLGVPGLLQAVRAGQVLMANAPGSAFLESPGLLGFLPALSQDLLGEELLLPSIATWWCGERAAMQSALPHLAGSVIKPSYDTAAGATLGRSLAARELEEWASRIERAPDEHTVQSWLPLAQLPTWTHGMEGDRILPRSFMLRVFAISDGPKSWRVLPGGLTRIASAEQEIASMQRGGSSADTWVLTDSEPGAVAFAHAAEAAAVPAPRHGVTSRAAENLFWLGRYTERTENAARLARGVLERLSGEEPGSQALLSWLAELAAANNLVSHDAPLIQDRRAFQRSLIGSLSSAGGAASIGYTLRALRDAASAVRERLSQESWNQMVRAEQEFARGCLIVTADGDYSPVEALRVLESLMGATAAMTGAQTDRMMRDDGWRLLWIGRHLERLSFFAPALGRALETGAVHEEGGLEAVLDLFDATSTFHACHQQRRDMPALLDLLVLDGDNPRSLASVLQTLRGELARLEESTKETRYTFARQVADPQLWTFDALSEQAADGRYRRLEELLRQCTGAVSKLSDDLGLHYFTHSADQGHSVGA